MTATEKAIRENFPGKNNAGIRQTIRKSLAAGQGIPTLSHIALTSFGKMALQAVREAYETENR